MSGKGLHSFRTRGGSTDYWARLTQHLGISEATLTQDLIEMNMIIQTLRPSIHAAQD